jgi:hypothetical protein
VLHNPDIGRWSRRGYPDDGAFAEVGGVCASLSGRYSKARCPAAFWASGTTTVTFHIWEGRVRGGCQKSDKIAFRKILW